jgi:hypothetical protein
MADFWRSNGSNMQGDGELGFNNFHGECRPMNRIAIWEFELC